MPDVHALHALWAAHREDDLACKLVIVQYSCTEPTVHANVPMLLMDDWGFEK